MKNDNETMHIALILNDLIEGNLNRKIWSGKGVIADATYRANVVLMSRVLRKADIDAVTRGYTDHLDAFVDSAMSWLMQTDTLHAAALTDPITLSEYVHPEPTGMDRYTAIELQYVRELDSGDNLPEDVEGLTSAQAMEATHLTMYGRRKADGLAEAIADFPLSMLEQARVMAQATAKEARQRLVDLTLQREPELQGLIAKSSETEIGGHRVSLEMYEDGGEQRSDCHIETRDGRFCGSLEVLTGTGHLHSVSGDAEVRVKQFWIDKIEAWALENGY
jgi:hypothetical protein